MINTEVSQIKKDEFCMFSLICETSFDSSDISTSFGIDIDVWKLVGGSMKGRDNGACIFHGPNGLLNVS